MDDAMHARGELDNDANQPPFPFALMLLAVVLVFLMPIVVLLYAGRSAAHHAPRDLPAAAQEAIDRGHAIDASVVTLPAPAVRSQP